MLTLMKCNSDSITSNNFPNQPSFDIQSVVPCSGRGDCLNGTCMCEIRYSGDECDSYNIPYHAGKFIKIPPNESIYVYYLICRFRSYLFFFLLFHLRSFSRILLCRCIVDDSIIYMLRR